MAPNRMLVFSVIAIVVPLGFADESFGQGQTVEVQLDVPGLGQPIASGLYLFKFAIVDSTGSQTLWSHDGTSFDGREPETSHPISVENGRVFVTLGTPPISGQPAIDGELLERGDVLLRVWVSNGKETRFRRLSDQRLRGRGFAHSAENARNALNSERLQGLGPDAFEIAGATWRHESLYVHTPVGSIPGGRLYHSSVDLGAGREVTVHFDTDDRTQLSLALYGSATAGAPSLADLRLKTARTTNLAAGASVSVVEVSGSGFFNGVRNTWDYCHTCFRRKVPPILEVKLDGVKYDTIEVLKEKAQEASPVGRVDDLALVGLVRFQRSLEVTLTHGGIDDATGGTTVWYYTLAESAGGAPGAIQILLDGTDLTPAFLGRSEASRSMRPAEGRLIASRFDGADPDLASPDPIVFTAPPDAVWLVRGSRVQSEVPRGGALTLDGYVWLSSGSHTLTTSAAFPNAIDLFDSRRHPVPFKDGRVNVPDDGWYRVRVVAAAPPGPIEIALTVDGTGPRVRTELLLGGGGDEGWSLGPIDLRSLGAAPARGPHTLVVRNRSDRNGHIEYNLLLE